MTSPLVLVVGRLSDEAQGVRGEAFAAGRQYFRSVERAGGVPLMMPPIPSLLDRLPALIRRVDAVVLHGGGDVDPRRYGQQAAADELYGIVPEHDEVELATVRAALDADLPTLAICRGLQVLNVALGGTLVQHIGSEAHWFQLTAHTLDADSLAAKAMGTDSPAECHCVHHQAVDVVATDLRVTSRDAEGIVHAAELSSARWLVATQWHPEDTAEHDPQQQGLFEDLVRHT
jgi:putative glutamine amidotransferase